jgi:hypothetical protein
MAQFHDFPSRYLEMMRDALPLYDELQSEVVRATADLDVARMLDLGSGRVRRRGGAWMCIPRPSSSRSTGARR